MSNHLLNTIAALAPVALGFVSGAVGARMVRRFRRLTGDNSVLTKILSLSTRDVAPAPLKAGVHRI